MTCSSFKQGRPLSRREHEVLSVILRGLGHVGTEFSMQLPGVLVQNWAPAGSPSFDLCVQGGPVVDVSDGPIDTRAFVVDGKGEYLGELILWISAGRLSALEYAWVIDEVPSELPDLDQIRLTSSR